MATKDNRIHTMKRNDTLNVFEADLWQKDGTRVPIENATFVFLMHNDAGLLAINRPGTVAYVTEGGVERTRFTFAWTEAETAVAGGFNAEVEIWYSGEENRLTYPQDNYFTIIIVEDLNPPS